MTEPALIQPFTELAKLKRQAYEAFLQREGIRMEGEPTEAQINAALPMIARAQLRRVAPLSPSSFEAPSPALGVNAQREQTGGRAL